MKISQEDKDILRKLAAQKAEIAALPEQKQNIDSWKKINSLKEAVPQVWINEIPWHEMNVDDELTLKCEDDFCRDIEVSLRRELYQWKHMPGNMVVEDVFLSMAVVRDSGFGMMANEDMLGGEGIVSHDYKPQITCEADVEKIKDPVVEVDTEKTEEKFHALSEIFDGILKVRKFGRGHQWFAPWDLLITYYGVEEAMMDLVIKPELVHMAMDRVTNAHLSRLEQQEKLGLLELTNGNFRIGSGGLGYCDELPPEDFDSQHVRPADQWGCATAQIFSEVSPDMHMEFALKYESKWLNKFGMTYYGCCEPLHNKIDILKTVPNLRKISMSPWADAEKMKDRTEGKYVLSFKPNPAILARDDWNPAQAKKEIRETLDKVRGCPVEIIMKDISTVRNRPERLWEWSQIAVSTAEEFFEG